MLKISIQIRETSTLNFVVKFGGASQSFFPLHIYCLIELQ